MADERPVIDAISGKKRRQQYDDRIDYESNGGAKDDGDKIPATDAENDARYREQRAAKSRQVRTAVPDKSTRVDPIGYLRGKTTDAMVAIHNRFSDRKID
jgi:hypothetical protein